MNLECCQWQVRPFSSCLKDFLSLADDRLKLTAWCEVIKTVTVKLIVMSLYTKLVSVTNPRLA